MPVQVKDFAPADIRDLDKKIPILTTSEGIGERVVLEEAESAINGWGSLLLYYIMAS